MMERHQGLRQPVEAPRWRRIGVGYLLLFGTLFFGAVALILLVGFATTRDLLTSSNIVFFLYFAVMWWICGVTGVGLVRMTARGHLYSPEGSMRGGAFTFTIGCVLAICMYHVVRDFVWITVLPMGMGMLLYSSGRRRMTAQVSGS